MISLGSGGTCYSYICTNTAENYMRPDEAAILQLLFSQVK